MEKRGGSAHNGLSTCSGATNSGWCGASTFIGALNDLPDIWVGWNDPRAFMGV